MEVNDEDSFKTGFYIWLSLCFVVCGWFLQSYMKGRRLFQNNLHVIEDGLKRMQEQIDSKETENSIGFEDDIMKELADFCKKSGDKKTQDMFNKIFADKEEESELLQDGLKKEMQVGEGEAESQEDDKKNV
ncbi:hypothetical protein NQ315_008433 [Exocentrus adspersus]|uniref:Uncharacterized protein n=1 Tax=Exocentrus adspersus TaxID=1586481 RepID=A0AAV8W5P5_9CUCU|nr:hypothetical protein NQ315_008433 [Exocentrus adspersus]